MIDIQEEREAFEDKFPIPAHWIDFDGLTCKYICKYNAIDDQALKYQARWEAWLAAKAQAVPEWISTSERMPEEGEEVLVHSLGQVRQVTRDSKWAGGFKERNCYGWQAAYSQSHWMPKSIELPEQYHFYYENDAKQKAMIEAQEQKG